MKTELLALLATHGADNAAVIRLKHNLPKLVVERYAGTWVFIDHSNNGDYRGAVSALAGEVPGALLYKWRNSKNFRERNGIIISGTPDGEIVENGVKYAVDLVLNQDTSFYADTRNLRKYLLENSSGKRVLNTFAYTGSLGVAALAGNADHVVQTDLSGKFLALAKRSLALNGLDAGKMEVVEGNFFPVVSAFKKSGRLFDTVILDPPSFSQSNKGTVDLLKQPVALVNKVRPIVADGGEIIMVNNALYLSGAEFIAAADELCDGKYLFKDDIIDIPEEFCGDLSAVADPAPFNHPTKIIRFKVRRKSL